MIKKKLAAIAAAAVAACSISATAFAAGRYTFDDWEFVEGQTVTTKRPRLKDDNLEAVVYVTEGLESGDSYMTFTVVNKTATMDVSYDGDLWVNGRCPLTYKPGYGYDGEEYRLKFHMDPQANAHTLTITGSWTP